MYTYNDDQKLRGVAGVAAKPEISRLRLGEQKMVCGSDKIKGAAVGIYKWLSNFFFVFATAFILTSLITPQLAVAQADLDRPERATEDAEALAEIEKVVVKGSRIARSGFTAPTPETVVGGEDFDRQGPTSIADVLTQLPSFRATNSSQTANVTSIGGGRYIINLRTLGPSRTLVLLGGHCYVPSSPAGTVDFNQFPTLTRSEGHSQSECGTTFEISRSV